MKYVFKTPKLTVETEDGGAALIAEISPPQGAPLFVRVQSYDESHAHAAMKTLIGQRVRVTVEIL